MTVRSRTTRSGTIHSSCGTACRRSRRCRRSLYDLVQLATVKPHAAALRAIIDLDTAAFGHDECFIVNGTLHALASPVLVSALRSIPFRYNFSIFRFNQGLFRGVTRACTGTTAMLSCKSFAFAGMEDGRNQRLVQGKIEQTRRARRRHPGGGGNGRSCHRRRSAILSNRTSRQHRARRNGLSRSWLKPWSDDDRRRGR